MKSLGIVPLVMVLTGCGGAGSFERLLARPTGVAASFHEVAKAWDWLLPTNVEPLLVTALGDVVFRDASGAIFFLDTAAGTFTKIATSEEQFAAYARDASFVSAFFDPDFVHALQKTHGPLKPDMVFSPVVPEILSGKRTADNFTPSRWDAHLWTLGQIHEQVKDLPPGTPITKINVEPW